jgi:nucleotide-binding universal stress UspA family protein
VGARLGGSVHTHVLPGSPTDELIVATAKWAISDDVLSSHGRTGLAYVVLGSAAKHLARVKECWAASGFNVACEEPRMRAAEAM